MSVCMLTLVSNPFDPFDDYENWLRFDHKEGFDTAGLLARLSYDSDALSLPDQELAIEDAIDSIVQNPSFGGMYKKVKRNSE